MSCSFHFLSNTDFETERIVSDYLDWADKTARQFERTQELRNAARLADGLAKQFFGEVWPLYLYMKSRDRQFKGATVQHSLGNQSFDATIHKPRKEEPSAEIRVEITAPRDGEQEKLRMQYLAEHGRVSVWGPITRQRDKTGKVVMSEVPEARERDEIVADAYQWIEKGLTNKLRSLCLGKYNSHMMLIIMIEDIGLSRFEEGLPRIPEIIDRVFRRYGKMFEYLVVIGTAGRVYFDDTDKLFVEGTIP